MQTPRVLLVASPWRHPGEPALALPLLAGLLTRAGLPVRTLFGSLLYPRTDTESTFLDRYGAFLFAPLIAHGPSAAAAKAAIVERWVEDVSLHGVRRDPEVVRREAAWLEPLLERELERARRCVDRVVEQILACPHDVLAFSLTFESQLPATLSVIERVRAQRPDLKIILGGAGCQEEQGEAMVRSFAHVDAVCCGEGEPVILPLIRALAGDGALADVPGIAYRDGERVVRTASPPLLRDLDDLPTPEYHDFFAQLAASEWHDIPVKLMFETSRGCWWGQKHLCSFCGLNGEGLAFRHKSPARAFAEIERLYRDYPGAHYLIATDNIIAIPYFEEVMPRLAAMAREPGRPLRIFYEIKSNVTPEQVELLAAAGVRTVQPGIESFSDEVLTLMDKGCTALGQVQFVKWAAQSSICANYNLLVRNPNESARAYREMAALMRSLFHLPPPNGVVITQLERFSPYHRAPERYGIREVRPHRFYSALLPEVKDLGNLAYHFEYQHPTQVDAELLAAHREVCTVIDAWHLAYREGLAYWIDRGDEITIVDERSGSAGHQVLRGARAALFHYLDRYRSYSQIAERFPELDGELLRGLLERWHHQRLVYAAPPDASGETRHLALLPRRGPAALRAAEKPRPGRRLRRLALQVVQG